MASRRNAWCLFLSPEVFSAGRSTLPDLPRLGGGRRALIRCIDPQCRSMSGEFYLGDRDEKVVWLQLEGLDYLYRRRG